MMVFPFALVLMYGRMLGHLRHASVIFTVMMVLMVATIGWAVYFDTFQPNPGLAGTQPPPATKSPIPKPAREKTGPFLRSRRLPVDQHLGNLEGKKCALAPTAGATFAAAHRGRHLRSDELRARQPEPGCIAVANGRHVAELHLWRQGRRHDPALLLYLMIGIFIAGQMVGRTPEYLGRKIGAPRGEVGRHWLLIHPYALAHRPVCGDAIGE